MRIRSAIIVALPLGVLIGALTGGGLVLAREGDSSARVEAQDLFVKDFAGDPSRQVFTFQRAGEQPKVMKQGEADYVAPNVVHHGMNLSDAPVKLFVVRIKPKDQPLTEEVPAPPQ